MASSPKRRAGFTLLELMIAMAIVGILAAIAYPSYREYVKRSNRSDAMQALQQGAQQAERWFTQQNSFTGLTAAFAFSGENSVSGKSYNLVISGTPNATSFVLRANPITGSVNAGDGFIDIDHQGRKRWDKDNNGSISASEENWNR